MLPKEKFTKRIKVMQDYFKEINSIQQIINKITDGYASVVIGEEVVCELIDSIVDDLELTNDGDDILRWWLYEDVDKVIYYKDKEISVRTAEELYDYLVADKAGKKGLSLLVEELNKISIKPKVEDGKVLLDKDNEDHRYIIDEGRKDLYRYFIGQGSYEDYYAYEVLHKNKFTKEEFLSICKEAFNKLNKKIRKEIKEWRGDAGTSYVTELLVKDYGFVLPEEKLHTIHLLDLYNKWGFWFLEYLGIYDEKHVELHIVKIIAVDRVSADEKFKKYIEKRGIHIVNDDSLYVIPLDNEYFEVIE